MELNIVPMEVFEEKDVEEAKVRFSSFCRKYRKEFEAEPRLVKFRINNLLGSWQQNREQIDFYNENTEVIKRIIDQHKKDNKLGPQLMKDRIERKRDKSIQTAGENDTEFQKFRQSAPTKLESMGVKSVNEITEADIPRDRKDANENEIEMGVHVIKPVRHGRRIYGRTKQSHFNLPSEAFGENDEIIVKSATEQQKEFIDRGD